VRYLILLCRTNAIIGAQPCFRGGANPLHFAKLFSWGGSRLVKIWIKNLISARNWVRTMKNPQSTPSQANFFESCNALPHGVKFWFRMGQL